MQRDWHLMSLLLIALWRLNIIGGFTLWEAWRPVGRVAGISDDEIVIIIAKLIVPFSGGSWCLSCESILPLLRTKRRDWNHSATVTTGRGQQKPKAERGILSADKQCGQVQQHVSFSDLFSQVLWAVPECWPMDSALNSWAVLANTPSLSDSLLVEPLCGQEGRWGDTQGLTES